MRRGLILCGLLGAILAITGKASAQAGTPPQQTPTKHPFAAKDWASLRSASASAVSTNGTILYLVTFGGDHGPTHKEWWTTADGSHAVKLTPKSELWASFRESISH